LGFLPICRELGLPLIVSTYGYDVSLLPLKDKAYVRNLQAMFDYATVVLAMSQDMRSDLIALGCPDDKVVIHHTSVDMDGFAFWSSRHGSPRIRILTICNYVEKKGLPYLIQAFAQARKQFPNVELRIVGRPAEDEDNDIAREVDRLIEAFDLHEDVDQRHFVPFASLPGEFAQADIFVLPSITTRNGEKEGIPTVLLEAQSSGLPVISTWHAGIPEAVVDGETGFLVEECDVEDLAAKLALLVSSEELRERMGKKGRKHIGREFNIQTQIERLERIYDRVINDGHMCE
jgi:colanic acid/amylovoran biosynthesis glycosyltransferase